MSNFSYVFFDSQDFKAGRRPGIFITKVITWKNSMELFGEYFAVITTTHHLVYRYMILIYLLQTFWKTQYTLLRV